jgi:hypothetical protein
VALGIVEELMSLRACLQTAFARRELEFFRWRIFFEAGASFDKLV